MLGLDRGVEKKMPGLENLNKRLQYHGGNQEGRMLEDKRRGLRKALLYSYQAQTLVTENGKEFRCLINPDKLKNEYDKKILSLLYEDICLNEPRIGKTIEGRVPTLVKPGDVFEWKENNSYWLVYLWHKEELAYFRADIIECNKEVKIGDKIYKVYNRGPIETDIIWFSKSGIEFNDLNYSRVMYITKNEQTLEALHRFSIIKIDGKPWEVQVVNSVDADGIIKVMIKETFSNSILDENEKEEEENPEPIEPTKPYISGPATVYPYDSVTYTIESNEDIEGLWTVSNNKAKITSFTNKSINIDIVTGRSGSFILSFGDLTLPVTIQSL